MEETTAPRPGSPPRSKSQLRRQVKDLIRRSGKSQQEVAASMGISRNWLSGWLNKDVDLSLDRLNALCDAVGAEAAVREALLGAFHPRTYGEPIRAAVKEQRTAQFVWVVTPHLRLVDDPKVLADVVENVSLGVRYVFCSANEAGLLAAADVLDQALTAVAAEARRSSGDASFVLGPRWLNLSAWRVVDHHKSSRHVARLPVEDLELRLKAGKEGTPVRGVLANEVCAVFAPLARLDSPDPQFTRVRVVPRQPEAIDAD